MRALYEIREALGCLLFPSECPACRCSQEHDGFCAACSAQLRPVPVSCVPKYAPTTRSLFVYGGPLRSAVVRLKYAADPYPARCLSALLAAGFQGRESVAWCDTLVPMPLSWWRERERGFNQSVLLARGLQARLGLRWSPQLLRRKHRPPQAGLTATERRVNVQASFRARPCPGAAILLVDDVVTTGSTLLAATNALLAAGARRVLPLTLAAALEPGHDALASHAAWQEVL
ncbi:MAG: ComF family protein [Planctomycetes bacterium]|nr:ComF family protein [Planctomycetota bacterium]